MRMRNVAQNLIGWEKCQAYKMKQDILYSKRTTILLVCSSFLVFCGAWTTNKTVHNATGGRLMFPQIRMCKLADYDYSTLNRALRPNKTLFSA